MLECYFVKSEAHPYEEVISGVKVLKCLVIYSEFKKNKFLWLSYEFSGL